MRLVVSIISDKIDVSFSWFLKRKTADFYPVFITSYLRKHSNI
jgi:hypothetical protein